MRLTQLILQNSVQPSKALDGNPLQQEYIWFSTGNSIAPAVASTESENNAAAVF
jgi:hypothetical protein